MALCGASALAPHAQHCKIKRFAVIHACRLRPGKALRGCTKAAGRHLQVGHGKVHRLVLLAQRGQVRLRPTLQAGAGAPAAQTGTAPPWQGRAASALVCARAGGGHAPGGSSWPRPRQAGCTRCGVGRPAGAPWARPPCPRPGSRQTRLCCSAPASSAQAASAAAVSRSGSSTHAGARRHGRTAAGMQLSASAGAAAHWRAHLFKQVGGAQGDQLALGLSHSRRALSPALARAAAARLLDAAAGGPRGAAAGPRRPARLSCCRGSSSGSSASGRGCCVRRWWTWRCGMQLGLHAALGAVRRRPLGYRRRPERRLRGSMLLRHGNAVRCACCRRVAGSRRLHAPGRAPPSFLQAGGPAPAPPAAAQPWRALGGRDSPPPACKALMVHCQAGEGTVGAAGARGGKRRSWVCGRMLPGAGWQSR